MGHTQHFTCIPLDRSSQADSRKDWVFFTDAFAVPPAWTAPREPTLRDYPGFESAISDRSAWDIVSAANPVRWARGSAVSIEDRLTTLVIITPHPVLRSFHREIQGHFEKAKAIRRFGRWMLEHTYASNVGMRLRDRVRVRIERKWSHYLRRTERCGWTRDSKTAEPNRMSDVNR